ncbi:MAG: serine hydrolase, partial [Trebonia sp.]
TGRPGPGGTGGTPMIRLTQDAAAAAIAEVAGHASGPAGLAARHLESGETLAWNADDRFGTASMIKVPILAAVLRRARAGEFSLDDRVEVREGDHAGGSGVLAELRPGLRCTVSDLCTLMIVVSDNTATNMLIDLCGGVPAVNDDFAALGFPGFQLNRKISIPPPPLAAARTDPARRPGPAPSGTLATVTLTDFCELMARLHEGRIVDQAASAHIVTVLRYQQHQALFPRAYLAVASPFGLPLPDGPGLAHKTGYVGGTRTDGGLLLLPDGGGTVAYAAAADGLADRTMTALAEGDEILGRLGAIVLARWWPGPGPVPVRDGWLPAG